MVKLRSARAVAPECRGGVGDAGAVEVDEHPHPMCRVADGADLVGCVQRAQFGRLRDRHDAGLHVVLNALEMPDALDHLRRDLRIGRGQLDELRAERSFRGAGLVGGDVRPVGAHDRVMGSAERSHHRGERGDVGTGAVEAHAGHHVGPEQVTEPGLALPGVVVGAVGERMAGVRGDDRLDDSGMGAGGVVAGERSVGCGGQVDHGPSLAGGAGDRPLRRISACYSFVMTESGAASSAVGGAVSMVSSRPGAPIGAGTTARVLQPALPAVGLGVSSARRRSGARRERDRDSARRTRPTARRPLHARCAVDDTERDLAERGPLTQP